MERRNVNTGKSTLSQLLEPGSKLEIHNNAVVKDNRLLFFRNEGKYSNMFDIYDLINQSCQLEFCLRLGLFLNLLSP
ncbi:hypothetical protein DC20_16135 [Rufibacter tibetensis]|uniref:Uncharacterized protein n=1 Tax=Rufibacter tibetensis TaxID=512763 RepID=A0A0N7HWU4_9BACT|nr:hypothetical protein DC20_16135 [Rufibacter tibetensis]